MKVLYILFSLLFTVKIADAQYQFVSPTPGATNLPIHHNIILREGEVLDATSIHNLLFTITGSKSGPHDFILKLCDDGKTINLIPVEEFRFSETVTVAVASGLVTINQQPIPPFTFSFTTIRDWNSSGSTTYDDGGIVMQNQDSLQRPGNNDNNQTGRNFSELFTINQYSQPAPGNIFFDCRQASFPITSENTLTVINSNGDSIYQRACNAIPYDFQMGKAGYFDSYLSDCNCYRVMDSNFNYIDSFSVVNGFGGDPHEFTMQPNGNAFLTGIEDQPAGDSSERVIEGSVIQEFDTHHNLLFEWRSFDHVDTSEAEHVNHKTSALDYIHTNSIEVDTDGNIITSHRHLDQVNKIDVNTGEFIWRLGGVKNEFTFINDSTRFSYQHDCRRLANGNITLYDDGNYHSPPRSYAKEYKLDEENKTATLVWSYTHPDVQGAIPYYTSMGSVQRLTSGNTFICWGDRSKTFLPSMTEVDSLGNIVWEITLASSSGSFSQSKNFISYRAHKYEWNVCARPTFDSLLANEITDHSVKLNWKAVANSSQQYEVQYRKQGDSLWMERNLNSSTFNLGISDLQSATSYEWRIQSSCDTVSGNASHYTAIKNFTTLNASPQNSYLFLLYPNPASGSINIDCSCHLSQLHLFNLLGQEVKNILLSTDDGTQFYTLSLSNIPAGNYLLEVITDETRELKKMIVLPH